MKDKEGAFNMSSIIISTHKKKQYAEILFSILLWPEKTLEYKTLFGMLKSVKFINSDYLINEKYNFFFGPLIPFSDIF